MRWTLWGVALAALAGSLAGLASVARSAPGRIWTNQDFAVYYAFGQAVREGRPLYGGLPSTSMPFTYPPFAAHVLGLLTRLSFPVAAWSALIASLVALVALIWLVVGACGPRGQRRAVTAVVLAAVCLWLEPVQNDLMLGQINLFICLLVVSDLIRTGTSGLSGLGVGVATGLKLTPGLFMVHFLITRQFRAFWTSVAGLVVTVGLGFLLSPRDSWTFWSGGFAGTGRIAQVTPPGYVANQSLHGFALRILQLDAGPRATFLWALLALPAMTVGLAVARRLHQQHDRLLAAGCVALTTLLVSPVSWSHHWVWVVVVVPAFCRTVAGSGRSREPLRRLAAAAVAAVLLAVFVSWPGERLGVRQPTGVIWHQPWNPAPAGSRPEFHWTVPQMLGGNAYVWAGLGLLVVAAVVTGSAAARRAGPPFVGRAGARASPGRDGRTQPLGRLPPAAVAGSRPPGPGRPDGGSAG